MDPFPQSPAAPHIVLLGDSTIDNVCWTGHPLEVAAQLGEQLDDAKITNYAADGFTSTDVLNGAVPVISWSKRREVGDPFPEMSLDRNFAPLKALKDLERPSHAVLSVGGNDVREILGSLRDLPEIVARFQANYVEILSRLRECVPHVVLMLQYRPSFNMDGGSYGVYQAIGSLPGPGSAVQKLNRLMESVYAPVLSLAREHQLAVADLPRTFDIFDDDLYCCQIEPSAKGGALIAKLLGHIVKHHDFSGPSKLLFLRDGEVVEELNDGGPWTIPHDPNDGKGKESQLTGQGVDTEKYKQLCSMGFSPAEAVQSLRACNNDLMDAISLLTASNKQS